MPDERGEVWQQPTSGPVFHWSKGMVVMNLLGKTPLVTVDLDKLQANIDEMSRFAADNGVSLRPHVKTHKSTRIARMQLEAGARGITVATVHEAEVMAAAGCDDILIAYTVVGADKYPRLIDIAARARLAVAIDSMAGARGLSGAFSSAEGRIDVMIEVDTGQHRCGVQSAEAALDLARGVAALPGLSLRGLMTHEGHSYSQPSPTEIGRVGREAVLKMHEMAEFLRSHGVEVPVVSMGSTPTARIVGSQRDVDEIRPGNYVFYDYMQIVMGVVPYDRCSLTVRARVISRPSDDRVVLDCGSKTLSSDRGKHGEVAAGYGLLMHEGRPVPGAIIDRLSEEHAVAIVPAGTPLEVGEIAEVIPNHACPVVNLATEMAGIRNGQLVEVIPVEA